jgi:hypothetical protein
VRAASSSGSFGAYFSPILARVGHVLRQVGPFLARLGPIRARVVILYKHADALETGRDGRDLEGRLKELKEA